MHANTHMCVHTYEYTIHWADILCEVCVCVCVHTHLKYAHAQMSRETYIHMAKETYTYDKRDLSYGKRALLRLANLRYA